MHQSNPGVRRRRDSQPSIHFPRSVYLPSMKTGAEGFSKFSFGAKKSSLAKSTAPPRRSEARSIKLVKSINSRPGKRDKKDRRDKKGKKGKRDSPNYPSSKCFLDFARLMSELHFLLCLFGATYCC